MPLIVRQARHWSCIIALSAVGDSVGKAPLVAANPHPRIGDDLGGCAYRRTTYRDSDFAYHTGQFGLPLHHLWLWSRPESVRLLGRDPSTWIRSLYRLQTINAARQLQHYACLMTSNLNVLDQYVLCLQGTATKLLELTVGHHDFPSAALESAAPVSRVGRASFHIEPMGLWRSPLGSDDLARNFAHSGMTPIGPPACKP